MKKIFLFLCPLFTIFLLEPTHPPTNHHITFFLVGGETTPQLYQQFADLAGGPIFCITAASRNQLDYPAFGGRGRLLPVFSRADANNPGVVNLLEEASGIWIGGGDQTRLMQICGGTLLEKKLFAFCERGKVIGGTSAGASAMSHIMVTEYGQSYGLGLLPNFIIDQHFTERGRLGRLKKLVQLNPGLTGIGIDESRMVMIKNDKIIAQEGHGVTILEKNPYRNLTKE